MKINRLDLLDVKRLASINARQMGLVGEIF